MNAEQLLALYDRVAEAPDAVARLRRFVLDLAVRGKLVEQDANDEPARVLLERIAAEKARLVEEGEVKVRKLNARERTEPIDFQLPSGWVLTELGDVSLKITDGAHKTPTYVEKGVPFISVKDFSSGKLSLQNARFIPADEHKVLYQRCDPRRGDILLGRIGTLGRAVLVDTDVEFSLFVSVGLIRFDHDNLLPEFFRLLLNSPFVEQEFDRIKIGGGTHTNKLNLGDLHTVALPLPPLAEQHRIVAKVDELMALLDRLEAARKEREATRDRLTAASLARLTAPDTDAPGALPADVDIGSASGNATNKDAFRSHARFALGALPALTTRPDQIKQLRQTILNLAVRGKLVPQDAGDEPARELLERKFKLSNGYSRRRKIIKEASVDASEGLLSQIPETWAYVRIQDLYDANIVVDYADGNHGSLYPRNSEFGEEGVIFVSAKDLIGGRVNWSTCSKLNRERANQLSKGWAQTGDVLLTHNATVGRVAIVTDEVEPFLLGTSVTFYRLNDRGLSPDYFFVVLQSPTWQGQLEAIMAQTTRNQVSIQKQAFFKIPLPPLAEQHRIVAKVDALMALCDRLEAALAAIDTTRQRLLEALLHEALQDSTPRAQAEAAE